MTKHLIHIGYPKTGSNFVRAWFRTHPQIAFEHGAIAGYSNVEQLWHGLHPEEAGIRIRVTSSESFATPHPHMGPSQRPEDVRSDAMRQLQIAARNRLCDLFPNAYVLVVTRGFRSMILSSYSQYVRTGGAMDLETLIADAHDAGVWNYDALLSLYFKTFGADRVIVLPWELMRDAPDRFFATLEQRLGLIEGPRPANRLNTSLSPTELRWYPRLARGIRSLPIGGRLSRRLEGVHRRAAFRNRLRRPIALLQRLHPAPQVGPELVTDDVLARFRGLATCLAADPLYAPYLEDYLL